MAKKRVLIATGGTGGHVYPAIALADQLKAQDATCEIAFIGGGVNFSTEDKSFSRFFENLPYLHHTVPCAGMCAGIASFALKPFVSSLYCISKGVWKSMGIIRSFQPDVIVGFGSYFSFPPLVAAKILRKTLILYEANTILGKVNRLFSPFAHLTAVHFPSTLSSVKGKSAVSGVPLRAHFYGQKVEKEAARETLGLHPLMQTILVFGGSLGAKLIHMTIAKACEIARKKHPFQVLHLTGHGYDVSQLQDFYKTAQIEAKVLSFCCDMHIAFQAADIAISRAGASSIAEMIQSDVPAILIPYPKAADQHQEHNAKYVVDMVKGGIKLSENGLTKDTLSDCIRILLENEGELLQAMKDEIKAYKTSLDHKHLSEIVLKELYK